MTTTTNEDRLLDQACRLQSEGQIDAALDLFRELERRGAHEKSTTAMIGLLLYQEKNDILSAEPYLRRAVVLSPRSESASLGLFHLLFEKGATDDAFDEMRRFLGLKESAEYRRLLADILNAPED